MNGVLAPLTKKITYHLAKALIEYDAILPRDRDVFVCWALESRRVQQNFVGDRVKLVCPGLPQTTSGESVSSLPEIVRREGRDAVSAP